MHRLAFPQDVEVQDTMSVGEVLQRYPHLSVHEELSALRLDYLAYPEAPGQLLQPKGGCLRLEGMVALNEEAEAYQQYYNDVASPSSDLPSALVSRKRPQREEEEDEAGRGRNPSPSPQHEGGSKSSYHHQPMYAYLNAPTSSCPRRVNQHRPFHRFVVAPVVLAGDGLEVSLLCLEEVVDHQLIREVRNRPASEASLRQALVDSSRVTEYARASSSIRGGLITKGRVMLPGMYCETQPFSQQDAQKLTDELLVDLLGPTQAPLRYTLVPLTAMTYKRDVLADPWAVQEEDDCPVPPQSSCGIVEEVISYTTTVVVAVLHSNERTALSRMVNGEARSLEVVKCPALLQLSDALWLCSRHISLDSSTESPPIASRSCRPREEFELLLVWSLLKEARLCALTTRLLALARRCEMLVKEQQKTKHHPSSSSSSSSATANASLIRQTRQLRDRFAVLSPKADTQQHPIHMLKTHFILCGVAPLRAEALAQIVMGIPDASSESVLAAAHRRHFVKSEADGTTAVDVKMEPLGQQWKKEEPEH